MKLIIDDREKALIEAMRKLLGDDAFEQCVEVTRLAVADAVTSAEDVEERKRGDDLVKSKRTGHLDEQLIRHREVTDRPIVIVEDLDMAFQYTKMVHRGKKSWPEKVIVPAIEVYGILASLALKQNATIIPTRNVKETAILLERLAVKGEELNRGLPTTRGRRRLSTLRERRDYFLQGLTGLGPTHVKGILDEFGTPWAFFVAVGKTYVTSTGVKGQPLKNPKFSNATDVTGLSGFGPKTVLNIQTLLWGEE